MSSMHITVARITVLRTLEVKISYIVNTKHRSKQHFSLITAEYIWSPANQYISQEALRQRMKNGEALKLACHHYSHNNV